MLSTRKFRAFSRLAAVLPAAMLFGAVLAPSAGFSQMQDVVRVRGSVASLDGSVLTVKSRQGSDVTVKLADGYHIGSVVKAQLTDIKPGVFIGTASVPKEGGSHALEVLIFPEALRGTGEGDYAWDLAPNSMMTNGTIGSAVEGVDGATITVAYKGGERRINVTPDTPVVTLGPAEKADIAPGTAVFLVARKQADGSLGASAVTVGKNGVVPPM